MLIPSYKFAPYKPFYINRTLNLCLYTFGDPFFSTNYTKVFIQSVTRVNYVTKT